jgi:PhnB protein
MGKGQPKGYHTITPQLVVSDGIKAIEFYKKAFGATEVSRMVTPDGKLGHAELQIGDSRFMLSDEWPGFPVRSPQSVGGTTATLHLYFADVDAAFQQAVQAGAKAEMPVADMFWGDRYGKVSDPFGHWWGLATRVKELTQEELNKAAEAEFAKMKARTQHG